MTAKTNHPTNGDASVSGTTTTGQHHHPEQQQQQQQPTMQPSPPHASQSMLQPQIQPPPPQASPKSHYTVEESSVIMEGMLWIHSDKERERALAEQILHSLGRFIIFLHPYQPLFFFFHLLPFPMLHCLIFVRHFVETGISLWQELA